MRATADTDGHEVIEEFVDDGYSSARLDRPALDRLRDAAEAGVLDGVICLCADRLTRAYAYQVLILEELERFGVGGGMNYGFPGPAGEVIFDGANTINRMIPLVDAKLGPLEAKRAGIGGIIPVHDSRRRGDVRA